MVIVMVGRLLPNCTVPETCLCERARCSKYCWIMENERRHIPDWLWCRTIQCNKPPCQVYEAARCSNLNLTIASLEFNCTSLKFDIQYQHAFSTCSSFCPCYFSYRAWLPFFSHESHWAQRPSGRGYMPRMHDFGTRNSMA
jgi:hypothetical protein